MLCVVATCLFLISMSSATAGCITTPPFNTKPIDFDGFGNSAQNLEGCFRDNGGPQERRVFLGTNFVPGRLTLIFAVPFTDGPGDDFALLTASQSWGPLASTALIEFLLGGATQATFDSVLAPSQLFTFELPGTDVIADSVRITNTSPDPPGIDNLAGMTFDDAAVAHVISTPASIVLVSLGLAVVFGFAPFHAISDIRRRIKPANGQSA